MPVLQLTMPEYRRTREPGETYFFTVVTFDRQPILTDPKSRAILRKAWLDVQSHHPFETIAVCLLPDHLHTIWRLPEGDSDYPMRWREIKRKFTHEYVRKVDGGGLRNVSRVKRKEAAIWQRRYWEHTFYEDYDLNTHIDYIHFNPMKHGLVKRVADWPWSSFNRYVRMGVYSSDWGGEASAIYIDMVLGE
jgi:putative transposase